MMPTELQPTIDPATVERVILHGDLSKLSPAQKVSYYRAVCESVGLNPLTQPFQYIVLNGREVLYARREATEQLRKLHHVSIEIKAREPLEGCYVVTARATLPDGRTDESIGVVPLEGLKGEVRANAMMKGETKAKRRATLSICGLGMLDETEVESLPAPAVAVPQSSGGLASPRQSTPEAPIPEDPVQVGYPLAELPAGAVQIVRIDKNATKNPSVTRYVIATSDGNSYSTINEWVASVAEQMMTQKIPVRLTSRRSKFGAELVSVSRADEPELPLETQTPTPDDDIPF